MKIAIIGAGKGGYSLIKSLSNLDGIYIKLVVDPNSNAPGIELAKSLGISCSNSIENISDFSFDTIIEATGNSQVINSIYSQFSDSHNIIDSHGALLIMTLVERDIHTLNKLNNQMNIINTTTSQVQKQLSEITFSVETIQNVNEKLVNSTKTSTKHIQESDKIIQYVNNIAKQIKILGINATIEAARAGEYGRGFSVVANEIQVLANNSARFANEINEILLKLSKEMHNINEEVNRLDSLSQSQVAASQHVNEAVAQLVEHASA